jgi:antimicrobial peptide system SdpA family protein
MSTGSAASVASPPGSEPDADVSAESDIRLGRRLAVAFAAAGCLIATVLYAALPGAPFDVLSAAAKQSVIAVAPEGWAFFTRSPRLATPIAYEHEPGGTWRSLAAAPLARPSDVMGLDRRGRARETELATLTDQITADAWQKCQGDPLICLSSMRSAATVANTSSRTVCGDVGVVLQDVLPWAFRHSATVMPSKVTRIQVTC